MNRCLQYQMMFHFTIQTSIPMLFFIERKHRTFSDRIHPTQLWQTWALTLSLQLFHVNEISENEHWSVTVRKKSKTWITHVTKSYHTNVWGKRTDSCIFFYFYVFYYGFLPTTQFSRAGLLMYTPRRKKHLSWHIWKRPIYKYKSLKTGNDISYM